MEPVDIVLFVVGILVMGLTLVSRLSKRGPITDPLMALIVGVLVGPHVLDLIDPAEWGDLQTLLERATEITLAIGLMAVALRLPKGYFRSHWRSVALMLGVAMPVMWLASGLTIALVLGSSFWGAMLIGGALTPTDPVVSTTIVTSDIAKSTVPQRLRRLISAESGANDGLAYPLVFLPVLMLAHDPWQASVEWLTRTILWEVGGALALAMLIGYGGGHLLRLAEVRHMVTEPSLLAFTVAMSLGILGLANLLGTNGVFAVFVTGVAFDASATGEKETEHEIQEAVNRFFLVPIFALLGAVIPWSAWLDLGWRAVAIVVLILLLRRLPVVLALGQRVPVVAEPRDAWFLGWFGPIGVAALYYGVVAWHETGAREAWVVASLMVCASVLVHGMSARPLTEWYGAIHVDGSVPSRLAAVLRSSS